MSLGATVKQTSKVIELIQDVAALRFGCIHYGLELLNADEIAAEYEAPTNGKNAFYRIYDNQNMSAQEIKDRMVKAMAVKTQGFDAEYVIRSREHKDQFQVGLVRGADGRLIPICSFYNTGRGLAQMLMSDNLLSITTGNLESDQLPDEAFERLVQARITGRTLMDIELRGQVWEKLDSPDPRQPLFSVRVDNAKHIDLTINRTGDVSVEGRGFVNRECEGPINRLASLLGYNLQDFKVLNREVPEVIHETVSS